MPEHSIVAGGEWPTSDLVAVRAAATPEREALVDAPTDDSWTYRELDAWVGRVARRLDDREMLPGRVGVLSLPRPAVVVLVHAAWRTGRELVLLNAGLAPGELADQVDAADVGVLVADDANRDLAFDAVARDDALEDVVLAALNDVGADFGGQSSGNESGGRGGGSGVGHEASRGYEASRDDVPVTLFTSGSTGAPKPVRVTVGNLLASATASAFRLGVSRGDRWLSPLPTYHMGGLAPAVRCALYGATVVLQREFDAGATASALDDYDATGTSLVPTALARLLDAGWEPAAGLRFVLLGGAAASPELLARCEEVGVPVHPSWGMTETASQIATATPEQAFADPETVGQPLVNATVRVVDPDGDPVARGDVGELVVSGPTVTPGYLEHDAAEASASDGGAAEASAPDRDADVSSSATLDRSAFSELGFHTGDRGYRDRDGKVYVVGRVDDLIVSGGENVRPARVADALRAVDGVADAAVVGLPDPEWGERVAALVATTADRDLDAAAVRDAVRDDLGRHEVPKTVALADGIPRTASGTVDRDAVRDALATATDDESEGPPGDRDGA